MELFILVAAFVLVDLLVIRIGKDSRTDIRDTRSNW
jgi:hypothetical protein